MTMRLVPNSKISIPELPPDLVHRTELIRQLDGVADVGLVSAPAGYGKTLLVAEWARASTEVDTAWVRVDRDDDDPRRLWSAVLASVARTLAISAGSPLHAVSDRGAWDMASAGQPDFLAKLIEALAALARPLRLVLDDLHEVTDAATLRGLQNFVRDRPPNVILVLASRLDPPFYLHRLRLEGRLTELRSDRLQFDRVEAGTLLRGAGLRLTPAQVDRLYQQTDGWPAGLRLAAAALDVATDVDWFLTDFSGDERSVADYLVGEVFSGLPADRMQLLQATSICEALPVGLAVVLSGREDAGWLLADLEHRTALVREIGQNRGVYRVQPLVRSHLLADLNRQSAHRIARLHAIAARWWRDWGRPARALEHAALSNDPALLTDLVRDVAVTQLVTGEHRPLRRALAASGEDVVASDPLLSTVAALVRHETGDAYAAEAAGRHASCTWPADPPVPLAILRAAGEELDVLPRAAGAARTSLPDEDAVVAEPELEALARLARCARRLRDGDDPLAVRRAIDHVRAAARHAGYEYLSLQCLGLAATAAAAGGDLRAMREIGAEAVAIGSARGWQASPWVLTGTAMLAYGKLLAAEPKEAEQLAADGLAHGAKAALRLQYVLMAIAGVARADQGDRAGGIVAMARPRTALGDASASRLELAALAVAESQDSVRLGRHTAARTVLSFFRRSRGRDRRGSPHARLVGCGRGAQRLGPRHAAAHPRRAGGCRAAVHPRRRPPAGDRACRPRRGPLRRPSGPSDGGRPRRATRPAPTLRARRIGGAGASRAALRQPRGRGHLRWEGVGRGSAWRSDARGCPESSRARGPSTAAVVAVDGRDRLGPHCLDQHAEEPHSVDLQQARRQQQAMRCPDRP